MSALENARENTQHALEQHALVVRAHDAVHPNRDECGGVGRCRLMMTEHEVEQDVIDRLTYLARHDMQLGVNLKAKP